MKGKRYDNTKTRNVKNNKKHSKKNGLIITFFLIIFTTIMIISAFKIISWVKENLANKDIIKDIQTAVIVDESLDTVDKFDVDFNSLKEKNPDTIAWIKVNGTNIEYPVLKAKDNDYYMTHSFDKSYNSAGWLFMDYNNNLNGEDNNMVIYGHNRRDGSMFGSLKNILSEEWQNNKENLTIPFITADEKAEFEVFSVYKIEKEDYYITLNFGTDALFQKFIDKVKSRSLKDFGVNVTTDDSILTLSTCADNNNYRVVLHAVKK